MVSLGSFAARMKDHANRLLGVGTKQRRKIALSILTELSVSTPVDVGRARSNWTVGLGGPGDGPIPAHVPGSGGSTGAANARQTVASGQASIDKVKLWQDIYLSNNLPYIARLNDGYSAQAPAGFVQTAVANGVRNARAK